MSKIGKPRIPRKQAQEFNEQGEEYFHRLVANGWEPTAAMDLLLGLLDAVTPLEVLLPGPLGVIADGALDRLTEGAAAKVREALHPDPAKIRGRAAELDNAGHPKRARFLRQRARRVQTRQEKKAG